MCENSVNGLSAINDARELLLLPAIQMPWHNVYFDEEALESDVKTLRLEEKRRFSSLYYFLSRVVNARNAHASGLAPEYDSPINNIALSMDAKGLDDYSQGVLWIWRK